MVTINNKSLAKFINRAFNKNDIVFNSTGKNLDIIIIETIIRETIGFLYPENTHDLAKKIYEWHKEKVLKLHGEMVEIEKENFNNVSFDGAVLGKKDQGRLTLRLFLVMQAMDGDGWHSVDSIYRKIGGSHTGISARIRDLRKIKFGGHIVNRRNLGGGQYEYQLIFNQDSVFYQYYKKIKQIPGLTGRDITMNDKLFNNLLSLYEENTVNN